MRPRQWLVMLMCAALAGCATSPPTRYYVLSTSPVHSGSAQSPDDRREEADVVNIGLGAVELPGYLDPTRMVRRTGPNTLDVNQFDRWSEPLDEGIQRVLAANLSGLAAIRIHRLPWPRGVVQDHRVMVHIDRFDAEEDGSVLLEGTWSLSTARNDRAPARHAYRFHVPSQGSGHAHIVAAMSKALEALSQELADAIKQELQVFADAGRSAAAEH